MLDDENDLVALKSSPDKDILSRLLRDHWPFSAEVKGVHTSMLRLFMLTRDSGFLHIARINFDISKIAVSTGLLRR